MMSRVYIILTVEELEAQAGKATKQRQGPRGNN